jgi:Domain of unknown function (DUF1905)/Bacteriocin-protection, YdeI or OmpD-Associated
VTTFRTTLESFGGNNVGIVVPDDVMAQLGRGKRVPVVVSIDATYTYRTTTGAMGGRSLVSFNAATRAATGRGAGDEVEVTLVVDDAPRVVEVPVPLAAALAADVAAAARWAALSVSAQRRHALAVEGARTDDTRARRVATVLTELRGT